MMRLIVKMLLGMILFAHAVGFAMASAQPVTIQYTVSLEIQADGGQAARPSNPDDEGKASDGYVQHLSSCHDHCIWSPDTTNRPRQHGSRVHAPPATSLIKGAAVSVSLPPPR